MRSPAESNEALVLHTSGTTARPKLVPLTHANLCASARNVSRALVLSPKDRCLNVMPLFHIHGIVASVLATLSTGGCVICAPGFDARRFLDWLSDLEPTWYTAVPTMHQAAMAKARARRSRVSSSLRVVRSSSAPLPPGLLTELEETFACPAVEAYGMTEAAHQIASNPLPPEERKPGSVGRPVGVEVSIVDQAGTELPQGVVGEVVLRGAGVFRGYAHNPEANAAAFVGGWFRTGDQGSIDEDGYLFLRGRLKEIINRGGEKVSPREVDDVLLEHPAIAQAVTFSRPDEALGEDVAVAVVLEEGVSATERSIQEFAAERLADFKVPRSVVFLEELPTGPTGKVQRVGLADRLGLGPRTTHGVRPAYVVPRTLLERRVAEEWSSLLGVERVGAKDDFFDLGGDSIAATALIAWVDECGLSLEPLPVTTLLWASTLESFVAALEDSTGPARHGSLVAINGREAGVGSEAPFYFSHGHDGSILTYVALARQLRSSHPFYAIEGRASTPVIGGRVSIEDLARQYTDEIRAFQPSGPYYLGGWCTGGAIALEMARNLTADGERVGLVALLDPLGEPRIGIVRHYWRRFNYYRRRGRIVRALIRLPARRHRLARERAELAGVKDPARRERREAIQRYVPRPYDGTIALFRSSMYLTPTSFWERLAMQGVRTYPPLTGRLEEPAGIDMLADQLSEALRESDGDE